jgi:hypothetical protein
MVPDPLMSTGTESGRSHRQCAGLQGGLLAVRGQSPSVAFVHTKTSSFHGSCAPGTSSMRCCRLFVHSLLGLLSGYGTTEMGTRWRSRRSKRRKNSRRYGTGAALTPMEVGMDVDVGVTPFPREDASRVLSEALSHPPTEQRGAVAGHGRDARAICLPKGHGADIQQGSPESIRRPGHITVPPSRGCRDWSCWAACRPLISRPWKVCDARHNDG